MTTNVTKAVQETAHTGTDAAAQAAHKLIDRVAHRAEGSEEKLRESAQQAQRQLKNSWQTARTKSVNAKKSVDGFVRRHPLVSIGLALGVGALLMTRSKQRTLAVTNAATNDENAAPVH